MKDLKFYRERIFVEFRPNSRCFSIVSKHRFFDNEHFVTLSCSNLLWYACERLLPTKIRCYDPRSKHHGFTELLAYDYLDREFNLYLYVK